MKSIFYSTKWYTVPFKKYISRLISTGLVLFVASCGLKKFDHNSYKTAGSISDLVVGQIVTLTEDKIYDPHTVKDGVTKKTRGRYYWAKGKVIDEWNWVVPLGLTDKNPDNYRPEVTPRGLEFKIFGSFTQPVSATLKVPVSKFSANHRYEVYFKTHLALSSDVNINIRIETSCLQSDGSYKYYPVKSTRYATNIGAKKFSYGINMRELIIEGSDCQEDGLKIRTVLAAGKEPNLIIEKMELGLFRVGEASPLTEYNVGGLGLFQMCLEIFDAYPQNLLAGETVDSTFKILDNYIFYGLNSGSMNGNTNTTSSPVIWDLRYNLQKDTPRTIRCGSDGRRTINPSNYFAQPWCADKDGTCTTKQCPFNPNKLIYDTWTEKDSVTGIEKKVFCHPNGISDITSLI